MSDALAAILATQVRERAEADVQRKILALVFSKPLEQFASFPKNWGKSSHVEIQISKQWPDLEREAVPMIANLVGHLAQRKRNPVDVCLVRNHGIFSIVVRTESLPTEHEQKS